ncbi:MAG: DUF4846 domain-containing protein [Bacteroidia bacterium]|nr:DUF4846 domain-containing protein [Bacteroidia bacterium]
MKFLPNHLTASFLAFIVLNSCTAQTEHMDSNGPTYQADSVSVTKPASVVEIPTPSGFFRSAKDSGSLTRFLRALSFKEDNTVYLFDGTKKWNQSAQYAVLDIDIGKRDLQQCADATMRLRAEHLFKTKQYDKIGFHFTSGDLASWNRYAAGYRAKISGNQVSWVRSAARDTSYANFRKYMNLIYSYCGTRSMQKEVTPIPLQDIQPGDVFHQTGSPYGHAVTVMDVARDSTGQPVFLLSQSYMPAQSIHVLVNPNDADLSPWYRMENVGEELVTPEWTFPPNSLKRWND